MMSLPLSTAEATGAQGSREVEGRLGGENRPVNMNAGRNPNPDTNPTSQGSP